MQPKPNPSPAAAELRRCAEELLRARHVETDQARTEADAQRLIHELEVHQIELELQNVQLKESRDRMERLLEKYTDLYDFAPVGYLTLAPEGAIREANLAGASLLGIARSALVNRRFGLFVAPADRPAFATFLAKVFASKVREVCEVTLLREGKPPLAVELEATVFESGRACRVALTDLTERKRSEEKRLILNKLESTGILAGGIAHDFNNLLTVILLHIDLAQMQVPAGEELARHLELAEQAVGMARGLTQQLITFAEGGAPIRKPTCLAGVVPASVRAALSGSRVRGELSLAHDLWPAVVDPEQIGQVIRNVVLNAREAMPEGGVVSVRAENLGLGSLEHSTLPPGDYVRVSIADQGGGIAQEVLPKIFDPYFSTKQRGEQKGMGLGLTICHTIIQKHDGAITAESVAGVGTTFHLYLPASRKLTGKGKAAVPKDVPSQGRILVMDDEERVREAVGETLQEMGHEVELAEDGQRAVALYAKAKDLGRPFDAVLLDLTVRAGMGGLEALRALLQMDPAVKAIVFSGYANDPSVLEHQRHGFKAALEKPFDLEKLKEVVSLVMGSVSTDQQSVIK